MYYCTEPIYNCDDPQVLNIYYNITVRGHSACEVDMRRRVGGRVYLAAAIFNAVSIVITTMLFIYCASGSMRPPLTRTRSNSQDIKKACKRYSLKKRSVSATTLGAIGHLVFSTFVFLTQAFNNDVGCFLILWGVIVGFYTWMVALIIRAYRLRFLFRLNQLKVKYLRMSTAQRSICINDKEYRWYVMNNRNKKHVLRRPYIIYIISLLIIIVVAIPSLIRNMNIYGTCIVRWGSTSLVGFCGFFVVILAPFLLWYLKDNVDAHGIRTEIFIDVLTAIPFLILYLVWFFLSSNSNIGMKFYTNKAFGPGNWVAFFTIIAHCVSVVFPVFQYLFPVDSCSFSKLTKFLAPLNACQRIFNRKRDGREAGIDTTSVILTSFKPELSVESLERSLADPDLMLQLQDLAIRDFSSENVLFYNKYLILEEAFKKEIITRGVDLTQTTSNHLGVSKNWINSIARMSSTIPSKDEEMDETDLSLEKFLSLPIPYKLYRDFIRFYETYIQNGALNQVNISYRARCSIDHVFEYIYVKYPELRVDKSKDRLSTTDSFYLKENSENEGSNTDTVKPREAELVEHNESPPILNFGIFEEARKEVCWNIFNSVYPKLVNMY